MTYQVVSHLSRKLDSHVLAIVGRGALGRGGRRGGRDRGGGWECGADERGVAEGVAEDAHDHFGVVVVDEHVNFGGVVFGDHAGRDSSESRSGNSSGSSRRAEDNLTEERKADERNGEADDYVAHSREMSWVKSSCRSKQRVV